MLCAINLAKLPPPPRYQAVSESIRRHHPSPVTPSVPLTDLQVAVSACLWSLVDRFPHLIHHQFELFGGIPSLGEWHAR
jgi:hypothetical protein